MAEEAENEDLHEDEIDGQEEIEQPDPETDEDGEESETDSEDEVLTFGDDLAEEKQDDSSLIKHLRAELREARKREAAAAQTQVQPEKIEIGEKPTLAGCEYDEEAYETALDAWKQRKADAEAQETQATESQRKEAEVWQGDLKHYKDDLTSLGYADADEAGETVVASLNTVQMAVLIMAADRPGRVTYALSKHPEKLAELAKITNPVKLAAAVTKLEGQLKVVKRRRAPDPDEPERGSGGTVNTSSVQKQLAKLEKAAERSGNRTDLIRFKKKHGLS